MGEFCDRISDDVCTIASLIPRLLRYQLFCLPEKHGLDYYALVVVLIELLGVPFPFALCVSAESHKVFLGSLADDVRQKPPSVFEICQIYFDNELDRRIL